MLKSPKNPMLRVWGVLVQLGLGISFLSIYLVGFWSREVKPPVVCHDENRIYLATYRDIVVLDQMGKQQYLVPIAELGIDRARAIHSLGGDKVLISDGGDVLECDLPNRSCRTLIENASQRSTRGAGKVSLAQRGGLIFVAESSKQEISVYHEGQLTGVIDGGDQKLQRPWRILLDQEGHLVVADVRSQRLAAFRSSQENLGELVWSFSTQAVNGEAYDPIEVGAGDNWWVVLEKYVPWESSFFKEALKRALKKRQVVNILVIFDAQGEVIKQVDLPDGMRPTHLIPLNQAMLAVDFMQQQFLFISHDGDVLDDFQAPDLLAGLGAFQQEGDRYERLSRYCFAGMMLCVFLFATYLILSSQQEDREGNTEALPSSGRGFRYPKSPYDKWLALWVAICLLAFGVITVAWTLEDGNPLQPVLLLNLAVDFLVILPMAIAWFFARRRDAISVSLSKQGICFRDHRGKREIEYSSIQKISLTKFFMPGWVTMVSSSHTISFGTGFEHRSSFLLGLKKVLEQNNLRALYDEEKLQELCKQVTIGEIRTKVIRPLIGWSLALSSLFALSGFAFIADNGFLWFWCLGQLMLAAVVPMFMLAQREGQIKKLSKESELLSQQPATFKQDLKLIVSINTMIYLLAVVAMVILL